MTATHAPPEDLIDETPAGIRLGATLWCAGAELLAASGQITEAFGRDGKLSPWLVQDIERMVARLGEALEAFKEKRDV